MGCGLSRFFLYKGYSVSVVEAHQNLAKKLVQEIDIILNKDVNKNKITSEEAEIIFNNFSSSDDLDIISDSNFVIEAITENIDFKKKVLRDAESILPSNTMISSNTSALPISALATCLNNPEYFLGTHFFNPPHIMPLVEVIPGIDTSPEVVSQLLDFLRSAGKKPILVKECPGFLVNRVLGAYVNEVMWLLESRAGIQDVEEIAVELGLPMGPVTLGEMAGWDVIFASNKTLSSYYGSRFDIPPLLRKLVEQKRWGVKTGMGLLDHTKKPATPTGDLVPQTRNLNDTGKKDAKEQMLLALLGESIRCLDEGVARPDSIDEAMIMGAGLPKGPLAWADELDLGKVLNQLDSFYERFGPRFWASPILRTYTLAGHTGVSAGRGLAGKYK